MEKLFNSEDYKILLIFVIELFKVRNEIILKLLN